MINKEFEFNEWRQSFIKPVRNSIDAFKRGMRPACDELKLNRVASGRMRRSSLGLLFCLALMAQCWWQTVAAEPATLLTNIAAVKVISVETARNALPVRLRGVITSFNPKSSDAFMQDDTGAVYLAADDLLKPLKVGDLVEVEGVTDTGSFAPIVLPRQIQVLGQAALPAPAAATRASLADGRFDSERVVIEAEMLGINTTAQDVRLNLMMPGGPALAVLVNRSPNELPARLRRATVRLTGVAAPGHNGQRQATTARILVSPLDPVEILRPGPENPDDIPSSAIGGLLRFNMRQGQPAFVRIRGVVTAVPSSEKFFLQDESGSVLVVLGQDESAGIRASALGSAELLPGDRLEVIGGPFVERLSVLFRADEVRKLGRAELPSAVTLMPARLLDPRNNGRRVSFEGRILNQGRSALSGRLELTIKSGNTVAVADIPNVSSNQQAAATRSLVRVKGVLDNRNRTEWNSEISMLHMASLADLTVVEGPPTNPIRLLLIVGAGFASVGAFVFAWALVLRREVRARTLSLARANATLQASQEWQNLAIEATSLGLWDCDLATGKTICSGAFEAIWGYAPGRFSGIHVELESRVHPDDLPDYRAAIERTLARREPFHFEHRVVWPDGSVRWVSNHGKHVLDAKGNVCRLIGAALDISKHKRLEEDLRQAQKLEAIGQLAGGVAHDFNNILAALMMQISILKWRASLSENVRICLNDMEKEAQRAAGLTRQLLLFSRRAVMDMKALDLNQVVENLIKMLRRLIGEHIQLEVEANSRLPLVMADAGMMEQVLMNLVVNARDAMPKGGKITISTAVVDFIETPPPPGSMRGAGRYVCLAVADAGFGMDKATLERIFEPFFTTKEPGKGTGLGLATVHGIAAQHKGWVDVDSTIGAGSTFRVFIPATECSRKESAPPPQTPQMQAGKEAVFVVEDQIKVRQLIALTLRDQGYSVIEAGNGQEAMTLWQKHGEQVDLLITDMIMPEGMTGLELVERLRTLKPGLKAIISSGYSTDPALQNAIDKEGIMYLPKPYEGPVLTQTVRKCLDHESQRDSVNKTGPVRSHAGLH